MSDSQWTRDHYGYRTGIPRNYPVDRYSYGGFSPVGSPRNSYGLSHSLTDLTSIDDYEAYEPPSRLYGRPRTSSLTDLTGGRYDGYTPPPPPLTAHNSFPPRNNDFMDRINTRNSEDYDYRRVHGEGRNGYVLPSNNYIDRQHLDSHQTQNYQRNVSYDGRVSTFYNNGEYGRGDLGRRSNQDFRFEGYSLHRNSSSSDLRSIGTVEDYPRESYSRSSNENYRENIGGFSSLQRSRSCSDLIASDNEDSRGNILTDSLASERRQNYPLAQLPIPSFEEFKRKNSAQSVEKDLKGLGKKKEDLRPSYAPKNEKDEENGESKVSVKDRIRSTNFLTSKYSSRERRGSRDSLKSRSDPAGSAREKSAENVKESYYSQNDVIHNLMLKYGLYERSEKKRKSNSNSEKDKGLEISSKETYFLSNSKKDAGKIFENDKNGGPEIESNVRRQRIGRRASAVHHRDAPKLTHKSYSSLSPSTVQISTENGQIKDINNNLKINGVEDKSKRENIYDNSTKSRARNGERKSKLLEPAGQSRPEITIADVYKSTKNSTDAQSIIVQNDKDLPDDKENDKTQTKSSRTLWAAAKDRLKLKKSPNSSPRFRRKEKDEVETQNESNSELKDDTNVKTSSSLNEENIDMEPSKRRLSREELNRLKFSRDFAKEDAIAKRKVSMDSSSQGQLRKNGVHSSLLSITSSLYSTDLDLDDSGSWNSELDGSESGRTGNRKRWESFHSNVSADSGSAHMYEFETDSTAAEMEDGTQETQEYKASGK